MALATSFSLKSRASIVLEKYLNHFNENKWLTDFLRFQTCNGCLKSFPESSLTFKTVVSPSVSSNSLICSDSALRLGAFCQNCTVEGCNMCPKIKKNFCARCNICLKGCDFCFGKKMCELCCYSLVARYGLEWYYQSIASQNFTVNPLDILAKRNERLHQKTEHLNMLLTIVMDHVASLDSCMATGIDTPRSFRRASL